MRGKVEGMHFVGYRDGITPAYAGKRTNVYCKVYLNKDHPRLCGEKRPFEAVVYRCAGSPPPMREKGKGTEKKLS